MRRVSGLPDAGDVTQRAMLQKPNFEAENPQSYVSVKSKAVQSTGSRNGRKRLGPHALNIAVQLTPAGNGHHWCNSQTNSDPRKQTQKSGHLKGQTAAPIAEQLLRHVEVGGERGHVLQHAQGAQGVHGGPRVELGRRSAEPGQPPSR